MCKLSQIPEPHHSADAIATSLCYLRSYLNSSRFEGNKRKEEIYNSGIEHLDNQKFSEAIAKFNEAINIDPIDAEMHYGVGRACLGQGDLKAGENAAKKALELTENNHPDSQKLLDAIRHYGSGCTFLKNREWNRAIAKFQEATNQEPIFIEAHCGLGKAYLEAGDLEAAESTAEKALKLKNNYRPAQELLGDVTKKYRDNGKSYFIKKQYDQAIAKFQKAIEIDPKFKEAHLDLVKTYLKLGDLETAEREAKKVLRVDFNYEPASKLLVKIKEKHKEQGNEHQNRKAYAEAVKSYQQAISIDPKFKDAYNDLGMVYRKMEEYSNAISAYKQAIKIDESCHVAHTGLGIVYYEKSEYAEAVSSLKRAIAIKSDYQKAYYNLARTYFKMENLPDASETVLEATRLDVNDQGTLNLLKEIQDVYLEQGHDYFRISNLDAAELSAKKALKLNSNYQPAIDFLENIKQEYCKRGLTYLKKSEWKSAKKSVKKVLNIDQNYQPAYGLLKQVYYEEGVIHIKNSRYEKGINKLQKASEINPNCEKTHYYLGLAYFQLGRLKEAQLSIKNALSIQPNYPRACKLLSEINDVRNWLKLGGAKVRQFARWIVNRIGSKET